MKEQALPQQNPSKPRDEVHRASIHCVCPGLEPLLPGSAFSSLHNLLWRLALLSRLASRGDERCGRGLEKFTAIQGGGRAAGHCASCEGEDRARAKRSGQPEAGIAARCERRGIRGTRAANGSRSCGRQRSWRRCRCSAWDWRRSKWEICFRRRQKDLRFPRRENRGQPRS